MYDTNVNTLKLINESSNELDLIRFRYALVLVCSV